MKIKQIIATAAFLVLATQIQAQDTQVATNDTLKNAGLFATYSAGATGAGLTGLFFGKLAMSEFSKNMAPDIKNAVHTIQNYKAAYKIWTDLHIAQTKCNQIIHTEQSKKYLFDSIEEHKDYMKQLEASQQTISRYTKKALSELQGHALNKIETQKAVRRSSARAAALGLATFGSVYASYQLAKKAYNETPASRSTK
ncbi:MAG: hypothetical protein WC707_05590 [Candidatus Babeliaceae bacterium]|jgi:hypothetical protein